jgi:hypothetical protein
MSLRGSQDGWSAAIPIISLSGHAGMTDYRRNFIAGGCFFFTVNLADRRLSLLTERIDDLRCAPPILQVW